MTKGELYICEKPLTIKHLYTAPPEYTITKDWGLWQIMSINKRRKMVTLQRLEVTYDQRMKIEFDTFKAHFIKAPLVGEAGKEAIVPMEKLKELVLGGK